MKMLTVVGARPQFINSAAVKLAQILVPWPKLLKNVGLCFYCPHVQKMIKGLAYNDYLRSLVVTDALLFIDMVALEQSTKIILTDSSDVQQETSFLGLRAL